MEEIWHKDTFRGAKMGKMYLQYKMFFLNLRHL